MCVKNQQKNYATCVNSPAEILQRLSAALNVKNDSQLSRKIGEKRSTVGSWRSRNIPSSTIVEIATKHRISLDYIFFAKTPMHVSTISQNIALPPEDAALSDDVLAMPVRHDNSHKIQVPDNAAAVKSIGAIHRQLDSLQAQISAYFGSTRAAIKALATMADSEDDAPPGAHPISIVEVQAAAGGGAVVDMEEVTGHVWFRRDWLDANAIDPKQSVVMKVKGKSMEPVLMDGASILVDRTRTRRRAGHIYVIRTDDGLVAKRLGRNRKGAWQLESAHPEYRPFVWDQLMTIIGEVRWTARTLPTPRGV